MPTIEELRLLQALPLELKVRRTKQRIKEWVDYYGIDGVYVSFSGGKDSTVLLHIVRSIFPDIEGVFVNTGLEYPEIVEFVKSFENITILKPSMNFKTVIQKYGYPMFSKEISYVVFYSRKYLKKYKTLNSISQTDRQTDRQTDSWWGIVRWQIC